MELKVLGKGTETNQVYLDLRPTGDGRVDLVVCDKDGKEKDSGFLLRVNADGTIHRHYLFDVPGFQTDLRGRVKLKEN